ncbi:transposase [Streptomyces sp. NPDC001933]|uniref:transposase n=1 Tax=Streptomyces sp. NPDC001933 TaxID=3364626 RepID=UPI0036C498CF
MRSKYTKRYSKEYKRDAIALVRSSGRTVTEISRELGGSRKFCATGSNGSRPTAAKASPAS